MEQLKRTFSDELIKECQKVMYKKSGKQLTTDQAEICLDSFARLGKLALRVLEIREEAKQKNNFLKL